MSTKSTEPTLQTGTALSYGQESRKLTSSSSDGASIPDANPTKEPQFEGNYCMAQYYTHAYNGTNGNPEETLARNALDTAIRELKVINDIIDTVKNRDSAFNEIFFTNKYLGTTAFLTSLSHKYSNYEYIKLDPARSDNYYNQLSKFCNGLYKNKNKKFICPGNKEVAKFFKSIIEQESVLSVARELLWNFKREGLTILGRNKGSLKETDINELFNSLNMKKKEFDKEMKHRADSLLSLIKGYRKINKSINKVAPKWETIKSNLEDLQGEYKTFNENAEITKDKSGPTMILIDDFDPTFVKLYEDLNTKINLKDLHNLREAFIKYIIYNNKNTQNKYKYVLVLHKQVHTNDVVYKGITKTRLPSLWKNQYFCDHKGALFVELLWHIKNKKDIDLADKKFQCERGPLDSCNKCCLCVDSALMSDIYRLITQNEEKSDAERIASLVAENNKSKKKIDVGISKLLSRLFVVFENNPHFIFKSISRTRRHDENCFDDSGCLLDGRVKDSFKEQWSFNNNINIESGDSMMFSDYFDMLPLYISEKIQDNSDFIDDRYNVKSMDDVKRIAGNWLASMIKHGVQGKIKKDDHEITIVCTALSRYATENEDWHLLSTEREYLRTHKKVVEAIVGALIDSNAIIEIVNKDGNLKPEYFVKKGSGGDKLADIFKSIDIGIKAIDSDHKFNPELNETMLGKMGLKDVGEKTTPLENYTDIHHANHTKQDQVVRLYRLNNFIRYIYSKEKVFEKTDGKTVSTDKESAAISRAKKSGDNPPVPDSA